MKCEASEIEKKKSKEHNNKANKMIEQKSVNAELQNAIVLNGSKKIHVKLLLELSLLTDASIKIYHDLVRAMSRHLHI